MIGVLYLRLSAVQSVIPAVGEGPQQKLILKTQEGVVIWAHTPDRHQQSNNISEWDVHDILPWLLDLFCVPEFEIYIHECNI